MGKFAKQEGKQKDKYNDATEYRRTICVTLKCNKERINENYVEFVDICEDSEGKDLLTFVCPVCKQEHTSYRVG